MMSGGWCAFELTSLHDLAEDTLALAEVARRAVPAAVLELVLTLGDGHAQALDDSGEDAGVVVDQAALLAAERDRRVARESVAYKVGRICVPRVGRRGLVCGVQSPARSHTHTLRSVCTLCARGMR